MSIASLALLLALATHANAQCFKFEGALASEASTKPTYTVGQTVDIQWHGDTFFCEKVTVNTKVVLEMWEADYFGDDKVLTMSMSAVEANGFQWTVPYDLSAILAAGGDSESGSDFFFRVYEVTSTGNKGQSHQFKLSSQGAFISVDGPKARSFTTGSSVDIDVLSSKLPSRDISCNLKRPPISWPLSPRDYGQITKYKSTAAAGVQKKAVKFGLSSDLDTADNYYVECKTADSLQPAVTHTPDANLWFRIEKVPLVVTVTAPAAVTKPKANSLLRVTWSTNGAGLMPNDKFVVRLMRVNAKATVVQQIRGDAEVWSSTTANVVEPLVTAQKFDLPIPVEAGPTSWLSTFNPFDGTTNNFFVRLTLKSNTDFNVESARFTIDAAEQGCGIDHPASNESIVFGDDAQFQFTCKGYSTSDKVGRFALLRADGTPNPSLTTLDNAARALTAGTITFRVPTSFVQGWVYRVQVTGGGDPQNSHIFLGERGGNQCAVNNKVASCAGTPILAATYENEYQVLSITMTWAGPECNLATAGIAVSTVWQKGTSGAMTTTTANLRLTDNLPYQQRLLGDACPDCMDIAFSFVEYTSNRKSLSFDVAVLLPTRKTKKLSLGTVKFSDAVGAVQAMGVTTPCVGNGDIITTTTVPPVIITDPPEEAGVTTTMVVVGGGGQQTSVGQMQEPVTGSATRSSSSNNGMMVVMATTATATVAHLLQG